MKGALLACAVFALSSLQASFPAAESGKILFCLHQGKETAAIEQYLKQVHQVGHHDYELLRNIGIQLLERGAASSDPESTLMALFGAGVALRPSLLHILEKGISCHDERSQLIALQFLTRLQEDRAEKLISKSLTSPFLLTRLEAAFYLAKKGDRSVMPHIESLLNKIPFEVRALLPQILVNIETARSRKMLTSFLRDPNQVVRIQTLLHLGQAKRDDFLMEIRSLCCTRNPIELESVITALTLMQDHDSIPFFRKQSQSASTEVKLTALAALAKLGEKEALEEIELMAKSKNLFAITLLGELSKELNPTLVQLSFDADREVRINALISRLFLKDATVVDLLNEILLTKKSDLGFVPRTSAGGGLKAWQVLSSAHGRVKIRPTLLSSTLMLKETLLKGALELPEEAFIKLARLVLNQKQSDLTPFLIELLLNHQSEASISLLKEYSQKAGMPLIRNYCNLALYRLRIDGPYEESLKNWVKKCFKTALIQFREKRDPKPNAGLNLAQSTLTPQESSALLISSFEAFASAQNEAGIELLLSAIAYGNPKNRYALAGLLIRTTE